MGSLFCILKIKIALFSVLENNFACFVIVLFFWMNWLLFCVLKIKLSNYCVPNLKIIVFGKTVIPLYTLGSLRQNNCLFYDPNDAMRKSLQINSVSKFEGRGSSGPLNPFDLKF